MRTNPIFSNALLFGAWFSVGLLILIAVFMVLRSWPFFDSEGLGALWLDSNWFPTEGSFNLLPMVAGSLMVTLGAVLLAGPTGVILAIFGRYYAPARLASVYRALMELLSGIPSVVYGFWGLLVLVPWISSFAPPGASILAGIIVLAIMVLPLVVLTVDTSFEQTPKKWLVAADALALQRWSKVWRIVLPASLPSILSGITLQTGRALGETMAVLMVCGNIVQVPGSIFDPARTLTANIALEMSYASGLHVNALFVSGLLLFILTVVIVKLGGLIQEGTRRQGA